MNKPGIYVIYCDMSGKFYIGSSVKIKARWLDHKKTLRKGIHRNDYLQNSWNKYGEPAFEFHVIEYCPKENLIEREQFYLDIFQAHKSLRGYNISPIAASCLGVKREKLSEERKKEISKRLIGNKYALGFKHTEATRRKISIAMKGRIGTMLGKKHSKETKEKLSKRKGWNHTEASKSKMAVNRTKISQVQFNEIRTLLNNNISMNNIADDFGCSRYTINRIKYGKSKAYENWITAKQNYN